MPVNAGDGGPKAAAGCRICGVNPRSPTRMSTPSFKSLGDILARAGAACDAAEAHGTVCGVVSIGADSGDTWLKHLLDQATGSEAQQETARRELLLLRDRSRKLLEDGTLEFAPLLPGERASLKVRTAALSEWCQGFLYGLGLGGRKLQARGGLSGEAEEVFRDLSEISKAGFEGDMPTDEDETDYAEVLEYVRVGVQVLYEELNADITGRPMPPTITVH